MQQKYNRLIVVMQRVNIKDLNTSYEHKHMPTKIKKLAEQKRISLVSPKLVMEVPL